jgi:hypothetical protein
VPIAKLGLEGNIHYSMVLEHIVVLLVDPAPNHVFALLLVAS